MPKQKGQKVLLAMFQDPKPFESTSGKPIEAAGRLLIVNQEGSQAERFDCEYGDDGHCDFSYCQPRRVSRTDMVIMI